MAPTQYSAADTVRVALEAVDQPRRPAGGKRNIPYCSVFRPSDGLVQDYRVVVLAAALALDSVNPDFALMV